MSPVQFHRIQVSRAGVARHTFPAALSEACSLRQLLAALLQFPQGPGQPGRTARPRKQGRRAGRLDERKVRLKETRVSASYTSNDLLSSLNGEDDRRLLLYQIIAQNAAEVDNVQNAPAFSMGPYLVTSGQTKLLTVISIYSQRGEDRNQIRLLFMNAAALRIWREMGQQPKVIGAQHRPPSTALLTFGVPFGE
jgi:hypothetical protein